MFMRRWHLPTAFSSMIFCALVLAAAMVAGDERELVNSLRRNEMVGNDDECKRWEV